MHSQLLQDPAAMRVGGLVTDTQLDSSFLGGFPAGDQHQHLALALGQREYQPHRFPIRNVHTGPPVGDIHGRAHESHKYRVFDQR